VNQSPYATHADLSALRREIQMDMRAEVRDMVSEVKQELRAMRSERITSKQWAVTTGFSAMATLLAAYTMVVHY